MVERPDERGSIENSFCEAPARPLGEVFIENTGEKKKSWYADHLAGTIWYLPRKKGMPFARLMIYNLDGTASHDWREFQAVKNELFGPESEAVEIYPPESQLKDPSNAFFLWVFETQTLKYGLGDGRVVLDHQPSGPPQRRL